MAGDEQTVSIEEALELCIPLLEPLLHELKWRRAWMGKAGARLDEQLETHRMITCEDDAPGAPCSCCKVIEADLTELLTELRGKEGDHDGE